MKRNVMRTMSLAFAGIMAAGALTNGASIELSADAPLREPFAVWMQGGLTWQTGKVGIMLAAQSMLEKGVISL